ncbi:MAG: hypothetical protein K0Q79_1322 [Flavipsychrobacter sp.]|jgi:Cdc6-like AAA superfamily ATPase|nr:hypothetical protein [Flavipsychrobacter sp.]
MPVAQQIYPVKEIFKALNALKLSFEIADIDNLYVDFDGVRSDTFRTLMFHLGILNGRLNEDAGYAKMLYTGHTGSGKSTELVKLHHRLNKPEQYFSIYIDVEEYIQISDFKSEDLMVLLIASMVNELEKHNINYAVPSLQKIADDWLSDKEVNEEIKSKLETEGGAEAEIGTGGLLRFFSAKAFIKSIFSYGSQTSTTVRRKIEEKQGDYIISLNNALLEIRKDIRRSGNGQEIVFIVDGLEKLRWGRYDMYTRTFFQNARLINELNASLICSVPIDTLYDSKTSRVLSTYQHYTLPLIPINLATSSLFSQIITRRIDHDTFFEEGVLDYCVQQSGGSPRQLIRIVEMALANSEPDSFRINRANSEKACKKLGLDLLRRLTSVHVDILKSRDYNRADPVILDLLFSLALMEYNGEQNNRQPNPLLLPFLESDE